MNTTAEKLDTQQMIEDGFLLALSKTNKQSATQLKNAGVGKVNISTGKTVVSPQKDYDSEGLLMGLFDVRDGLIDLFSSINHNSTTGRVLTSQINKVSECIRMVGGEIKPFNPLDHISGLDMPDQTVNAQKVIQQTKQCYKLGKIGNTSISKDGRIIKIVFSGNEGNHNYWAAGEITTKGAWAGNEAIDYVYTPESGKMSVKALNENGCWVDKHDGYDVYWELTESDGNPTDITDDIRLEKSVKKSEKTKELERVSKNNVTNNDIDIDFPINDMSIKEK